jgi:hypothetical protein
MWHLISLSLSKLLLTFKSEEFSINSQAAVVAQVLCGFLPVASRCPSVSIQTFWKGKVEINI